MSMKHVEQVVQAVVIRAFGQPSITAVSDDKSKKNLTGNRQISNTAKDSAVAAVSLDLSDLDEFPPLGFTISPSLPSSYLSQTTTYQPRGNVKSKPKRRIKPTLKKFTDSSPPPVELKKEDEVQSGPEVIAIAEDFCTAIFKGHMGTTPIGTALAALFRLFVSPPNAGVDAKNLATRTNATVNDLASVLQSRADCLLFASVTSLTVPSSSAGIDLLSGLSKAAEMEELLQADLRLCEALRRASASAASEEPVPPLTRNSLVGGSGGITFEHPSHPSTQVERNRQQALDLFASAMRDNSRGEGFGRRLKERNEAIRWFAKKLLGMLLPCNYRWFARYFTAQLMGSADPFSPSDEDEVLHGLMGGNTKRLGYLKRRILGGRLDDYTGRQDTTTIHVDDEEEEQREGSSGPRHFFHIFLSGADSAIFNSHLRSELRRKLEVDERDCLPEWPPGALPLIRFLSEARQDGLVAIFVPWALEHLRMAHRDPAAKRSIEFRAVTMQLLKESKRPIDSPSSLLVACEVQGLLWQELGVNHNEMDGLPQDEVTLLAAASAASSSPQQRNRYAIGPTVHISKSLSKSCCPHLDKMHKALLPKPYSISLDDTALSNNTSSTKQKLKQQQIPSPLVSALRNQESGHPEVLSRSAEQRALANSFFAVHPLLRHTAEVVLQEASLHRDPSVVGQAVRLLAPPNAHPRTVEVAAVLTERHCRLENDQRSRLRILSKKDLRLKERDRGSLDIFDLYAGNPLALEEAILAQPSTQWRAAREKLKLGSEAVNSTDTHHHHPLYFSRLDAALAAQERCITTTVSTIHCVSISEEQRDDERK